MRYRVNFDSPKSYTITPICSCGYGLRTIIFLKMRYI